ncbi:unnamed protein product, partial [Ilex paraguariensis]
MSPDELHRTMTEIDTDRDGFIDLKEFIDFHREDWIHRDAFDMYDKDKNDFIFVVELHTVLKSFGEGCSLNDCRKMISSVDGDGSINFNEFKKLMN